MEKEIEINGRSLIATDDGRVFYQKKDRTLKEVGLTINDRFLNSGCG